LKIVLLGPPGAGKGTQAEKISRKYKLQYIDTGGILRKNENTKTKKGTPHKYIKKGILVPDYIVIEFILPFIKRAAKQNFILDGFPRSLKQVKLLEKITAIDIALYLEVNQKELIERISGRWICRNCDITYHIKLKPPKKEGICDVCGEKLTQREDDRPKIIRKRTRVFNKSLKPVIKYYEKRSILKRIDANRELKEVWKDIQEIVNKIK